MTNCEMCDKISSGFIKEMTSINLLNFPGPEIILLCYQKKTSRLKFLFKMSCLRNTLSRCFGENFPVIFRGRFIVGQYLWIES